jgi:hypothetical protein
MMHFFNESYESAMKIPVPFRKYFLKKYIQLEQQKQKNTTSPDDEPLSPADRKRYLKKP